MKTGRKIQLLKAFINEHCLKIAVVCWHLIDGIAVCEFKSRRRWWQLKDNENAIYELILPIKIASVRSVLPRWVWHNWRKRQRPFLQMSINPEENDSLHGKWIYPVPTTRKKKKLLILEFQPYSKNVIGSKLELE